jgi:hypothetical protein
MPFDPDAPIPVPYAPPREWFESAPEWFDPTGPLIQIDNATGRVAAIVAPYGECILDGTANCWTPPESKTAYEYAHVGSIVTEEGDAVRIANIGGGVPHANLTASSSVAADHYANTASRRMIGRYVDAPEQGGVLFLGSMWPGSTNRDMVEVLASALSGDWRWIQSLNDYEMVGAQLVNNPGFRPVPAGARRASAAFVAYRPAVTASASTPPPVIGEWRATSAPPVEAVVARLAALSEAAGRIAELAVVDAPLPPARTAAPRRRGGRVPRVPGTGKVVDGDGDGKVNDGTPAERPATPAEIKAGKLLRQQQRSGKGAPKMSTRSTRERQLKRNEMTARRRQSREAAKAPKPAKPTSPPKANRSLGDGNVMTSRGVRRRTYNREKGGFDYVKPDTGERPKAPAPSGGKTVEESARIQTPIPMDVPRTGIMRDTSAKAGDRREGASGRMFELSSDKSQWVDSDGAPLTDAQVKEEQLMPPELAGDIDAEWEHASGIADREGFKGAEREAFLADMISDNGDWGGEVASNAQVDAWIKARRDAEAAQPATNRQLKPPPYRPRPDSASGSDSDTAGSAEFKAEDAVLSAEDKEAITPGVSQPVADKLRADFGEELPGITGGTGTKDDPLTVSDVDSAVRLIQNGKYHIKMDRPDEVSTLLDRLQAIGDDAYKKGEKAPLYDLCRVTVEGTNLFCPSPKVEDRINMPQFATADPVPGSMADNLPRNAKGEVDLAPAFFDHLRRDRGVVVTEDVTVPASHLRASQNQLNGAKVAGMMGAMERGQMPPGSIIVTSDGYVVDGHHRWAATVGRGLEGGGEDITVTRIDADIVTVLEWANKFTRDNGSLPKAAALRPRPCRNCRG